MPMIEFTEEDLARGKVVKPSWYRMRTTAVTEKPSADKQSTNWPMDMLILFDGDTGDTEFSNTPVTKYFNSKGKGFIAAFLQALGEEVVPGRINLEAAVGAEFDMYIGNKIYEGRPVNDLSGKFRKANPAVVALAKA